MPEITPNLGLYLKNPVTDGNDTFNIETMLNQNWRKIDEKVALKMEVETSESVQQKIDEAIAGLINGAPEALDTLRELAQAMGDDPNFATTVLNRLTTAEQNFAAHSAETASLTQKGHVQLSSTISTDETKAATPKAVKAAYDLASAAIPLSQKGQPNGVAILGSDGKLVATQLPSDQLSVGTTTLTGTFPARTGSSPNYTYTVVTLTIPIGSTANEVEVFVNNGSFKVRRNLNYVISVNWSSSNASLISCALNSSNKGYDLTVIGSAPQSVVFTGNLFGDSSIRLIDAYLSGSNLVLKFINDSTSTLTNVSQKFDYIIKG